MRELRGTLEDNLAQILPGEVKTFLCPDVLATLSQLEFTSVSTSKFIVHLWERLPQPDHLIVDILQTLAKAAYEIWPAWYRKDSTFLDEDEVTAEMDLLNQFQCLELKRQSSDISLPWLKQAIRFCQIGKVPILTEFSRALQLSQLLLAIEPKHIIMLIVIADSSPDKHKLFGLAKSIQWLADNAQVPIALIISKNLANQPALDSVLYGAVDLLPLSRANNFAGLSDPGNGLLEEAKHILVPLQGRPHPFSPGEKLLADRLSKDEELRTLFQFNQTVQTVRHSAYLVDLLWADGWVVVEVDGYRCHGNTFAFSRDRHRDYELLISGYLVLRLPHDEVVNDIQITIEKIRDVVRFRHHQILLN